MSDEASTSAPFGQVRTQATLSDQAHLSKQWISGTLSCLMQPQAVCPGDSVLTLPESGTVRTGGGIVQAGDRLISIKAGLLRKTNAGKLWIDGRQKR